MSAFDRRRLVCGDVGLCFGWVAARVKDLRAVHEIVRITRRVLQPQVMTDLVDDDNSISDCTPVARTARHPSA
jgi:hypothetical protein